MKPAIDWRLSVTTGFWPAIVLHGLDGLFQYFFSLVALPTPMLTTIFCNRGKASGWRRPSSVASAGRISFSYVLFQPRDGNHLRLLRRFRPSASFSLWLRSCSLRDSPAHLLTHGFLA